MIVESRLINRIVLVMALITLICCISFVNADENANSINVNNSTGNSVNVTVELSPTVTISFTNQSELVTETSPLQTLVKTVTTIICPVPTLAVETNKTAMTEKPTETPEVSAANPTGTEVDDQLPELGQYLKPDNSGKYAEGEIIVRYKPGVASDSRKYQAATSRANDKIRPKKVKDIGSKSLGGIQYIKLPSNISVEEAVDIYSKDSDVLWVQPNYIYRLSTVPNDPLFPQQWGLNNVGQIVNNQPAGTSGSDIHAPAAWDAFTGPVGSNDVLIAVVDTGIDYSHPDLQPNIWTNSGEMGTDSQGRDKRTNGVDDDGNGMVDDWHGWNLIDRNGNTTDDGGHGTAMAGIIGAIGNNEAGISGINWNVKIVPVKVFNSEGVATDYWIMQGMARAIDDANAHIISNSWAGGDSPDNYVRDFINQNTDVLFIFGAGNCNNNPAETCYCGNWAYRNNDDTSNPCRAFPASYTSTNIISVASSDQNDNLAFHSHYGATSVDLAAPGTNITSTVPVSLGSYHVEDGTSPATAMVSGVAGLIKSVNPDASPATIKSAILQGVDTRTSLNGLVVSSGRLNAKNSIDLVSVTVKPKPDLIADVVHGTDPLTVHFTDQSDGVKINIWNWNFGNGNYASVKNPPAQVYHAGTYSVTLQISNGYQNSTTKTNYITVDSLPPQHYYILPSTGSGGSINPSSLVDVILGGFQVFTITPTTGYVVNDVVVNSVPKGPVTSYNLTNITANSTISATFKLAPPLANFTASPRAGPAPLTVRFNDTSTGSPTSWLWDFGDSNMTNVTEQNPVHTYNSTGSFTVNLTATNANGSNTITKSGYIQSDSCIISSPFPVVPVAIIDVNTTSGDVPLTVAFNGSTAGYSAENWLWNFGDGQTSTLQNPVHTYTARGNYTISLAVNTCAGTAGSSLTNWIRAGYYMATAGESQDNSTITVPKENFIRVKLYQTRSSGYEWEFNVTPGLNIISTQYIPDPNPYSLDGMGGNHVWDVYTAEPGEQSITAVYCRPWNPYNGNITYRLNVMVNSPSPVANFTTSVLTGTVPLTIMFNDTSTNSPTSWYWGFGDGYYANGRNTTWLYNIPGNYTINHSATNEGGTGWINRTEYIRALDFFIPPSAPDANFTASPTSGSSPLTVQFIDTSTGSPTGWNWDFGDSSTVNSTQQNPVHSYPSAGTFTVTLNATNSAGSNTTTKLNYITVTTPVMPPIVTFITNVSSGYAPLAVKFTDRSTGSPNRWNWSFGDGAWFNTTIASQKSPSHIYTTPGTYTASLIICNASGCNTTVPGKAITVNLLTAPVVKFTVNVSSGYGPLAVRFTDQSTGSPTRWNWSFGDGTWFNTTVSSLKSPTYIYATPGNYTTQLTTCNAAGCNTTVPGKAITVNLLTAPVVKFTVNVSSGYGPLAVRFTDQSTGSPTRWNWSFGDGNWFNTTVSSLKSPTYVYATPGNYTTQLTICNAAGCNTTVPGKAITVNLLTAPVVKFATNKSTGYAPLAIRFTDQSTGSSSMWNWSFGDDRWFNTTTSSEKSPTHVYTGAGTFNAMLVACNAAGCNTTAMIKTITVNG
jgi:PKD repeat protein